MTRVAHLWFLLGILISLFLAALVLAALAILGAIHSVPEMIAVAFVDAMVVSVVIERLWKRYRARLRPRNESIR